MNRSSPVNVAPISEVEPPRPHRQGPRDIARPASPRYAGPDRRRLLLVVRCQPHATANSPRDGSSTGRRLQPPPSRLASAAALPGSGKASREPMAICEPSGSPTARAATASRVFGGSSRPRDGRGRGQGSFMPAIAAAKSSGTLDLGIRCGNRSEHRWVDSLDSVQHGGDIGEQNQSDRCVERPPRSSRRATPCVQPIGRGVSSCRTQAAQLQRSRARCQRWPAGQRDPSGSRFRAGAEADEAWRPPGRTAAAESWLRHHQGTSSFHRTP